MNFGLRNAAQTFQRFMNEVTFGHAFVTVYINDILVASTSQMQHIHHYAGCFLDLWEKEKSENSSIEMHLWDTIARLPDIMSQPRE